jgi:hypothetical protein
MTFTSQDEQTRLRTLLDHYADQFPAETKTNLLIRQQGLLIGMLAQAAAGDWTTSRMITERLETLGLDRFCRPLKKNKKN